VNQGGEADDLAVIGSNEDFQHGFFSTLIQLP
jgi:hypothetical protein